MCLDSGGNRGLVSFRPRSWLAPTRDGDLPVWRTEASQLLCAVGGMASQHEIRVAHERSYRLALGEYERAEMAIETVVGMKALEAADRRIQARKRVLKERMADLDYLLRSLVDPEWTPYHLTPLQPRKTRRKNSIAKAAYQALRQASEPMKTREISRGIAGRLEVDVSDARALSKLDAAVRTSMKECVKDGVVEELEGQPTRWRVLSKPKWAPSSVPYASASAPLVRVDGLSNADVRALSASILQVRRQETG